MTALIDADSLVYIIAWNYREHDLDATAEVCNSCDTFLRDILTLTGADQYIGVFSPPSDATFRYREYKYAPYKGNRPEKADHMVRWEKIIKDRYIQAHSFFTDPDLEADDVIAGVSMLWQHWPQLSDPDSQGLGHTVPHVICSPDKDLRQIPGWHYDYRAKVQEGSPPPERYWVKHQDAFWNFWTQMLTGDGNDNVAGIPGLGEVKAKKIIDELKAGEETIIVRSHILSRYCKYFGGYYGPIIFDETEKALRLMYQGHPLYSQYAGIIHHYADTHVRRPVTSTGFFDIPS